jgi:hypothetical protein
MSEIADFVNRIAELKFIKEDIINKKNSNRIFIITGDTGIGKSRLTEKILSDFEYKNCVKVKVNAYENSDLAQGSFIRLIGIELNKYAEQHGKESKLINYLKSWSGSLKDYFTNILIEDVNYINPINNTKVIGKIIKYKLNKGEFNTERILNDSSHRNLQIITNYVQFFLKNEFPFLINIENIQLMDFTSLELFSKIIHSANQTYFLLEFTNNSKCTLNSIIEHIKAENIEVAITDLPKLSKTDFSRIILDKEPNLGRLIDFVYEQLNGNIRQLSDLKIVVDKNLKFIDFDSLKENENFNWTLINIKSLAPNDFFVLTAIVSSKSKLNIEQLNYIHKFRYDIHIDINKAINNLVERKLIKTTKEGIIEIDHDSISSYLQEENKSMFLLANKMWGDYYLNFYTQQDFEVYSKHDLLSNIFFHLIQSDPIRVLNILQDLERHILNLLYPSSVKGYVNNIKENFIESQIESIELRGKIVYFIIDVYYKTNFFEEAFELVKKIQKETLRSKLYKAVLLNRLDKHDEAIKFAIDEIEKITNETPHSYTLSLKLVLLASYRSSIKFNEWYKLFKQILKNKHYKKLKEYGVFLRNSEMMLSYKESLPYLVECIEIFNKLNDKEEEAYARIAYSMQLGRLGRLAEAMAEAKYAQLLLSHKGMDQYLSLNNIAVIEMLNGNFSTEVRDILKQGLITAFDAFSKQNILSNLLVWNTINNNHSDCREIIQELLTSIDKQPDRMLHRIIYYNIHFYYNSISDAENSQKFKTMAINCLDDDDPLWNNRFYNEEITDDNDEFLSGFKYHVDFLTYWHFEINPHLESYQVS